uniref:Pentapeptide repeat-containing protein n=1 Tax=Candidatus Kentrum sp. LFY TaxID=2126342 RepID=A0A450U7I7_9GAMM|nr:MAG: Pentapeptide repeat-containing protein [Candidatus Kentron sp. LFY]
MSNDYSQQKLRGRDFRDLDLRGADFAGARFGKTLRGGTATVLLSLLIGLVAGLLDGFAGFFLMAVIDEILETVQGTDTARHSGELILWTVVSAAGMVAILLFFLWRGGISGLFMSMGVIMALALALAGAGAVFLLPAVFIAWRIRKEDPRFAGLQQWGLWLGSLGGTDFRAANLAAANFRDADLKHVRLAGAASLQGTDFRGARNLKFAYAKGTPLETPQVRDLLASGQGQGRFYSGLNLHGANLSGANLAGTDFTEANLSDADLTGADLGGARLVKTQLIGADLRGARLTGACIQAWNIDKTVDLQVIHCHHVFLELDNPKSRQPPSGAFQEGEFSKLFQEVTETMDFLVETKLELAALQRAIAKLREQGAEGLEVQGVERKEDAVVVHVAAPPSIDRERIHAQALREKQLEMKLLEAESRAKDFETKLLMEERHSNVLEDILDKSLQRPIHVNAQGGNAMTNDRSQTITGSTITGSSINQGDIHGRLTQLAGNMGALPTAGAEAETELKELLTRLAEELNKVPKEKARDAEDVTDMVERTMEDAGKGKPSRLEATLDSLRESARSFGNYPAVVQTVSEIARLLGG